MFQEGIPHSELTELEAIGEGGFGVAYRAKHAQFGTVVYKELDARKLGDRYSTFFSGLMKLHFESAESSAFCT